MPTSYRHRRFWLLAAGGVVCASGWATAALAADSGKGPVLLTVSGAVTRPNDNGAASFDMAQLAALPQHSFSTTTPWYPQPRKFTGVLVRDLLEVVGSKAGIARAIALNDYRADLPVAELVKNDAMIAYLLDGQPMPVREKGPLVIIFPFSDRPELRNAVQYSRAVWQLRSLELR